MTPSAQQDALGGYGSDGVIKFEGEAKRRGLLGCGLVLFQ
jgi:hypothetical protein